VGTHFCEFKKRMDGLPFVFTSQYPFSPLVATGNSESAYLSGSKGEVEEVSQEAWLK